MTTHTKGDWPYFRAATLYQHPPAHLHPWYNDTVWVISNRYFSPSHLLYLLFPAPLAEDLQLVICVLIAAFGGYLLARKLRLNPIAAALLFPSSSWLAWRFVLGHLSFLPFVYLPWMVLAILQDAVDVGVALLTLCMVLALYDGAPYVALEGAALLALVAMLQWKLKPFGILALSALFTALITMPKLMLIPGTEGRYQNCCDHLVSLTQWAGALFYQYEPQHLDWPGGGTMGVWEASAYISPLLLPLIVRGTFRQWRWALIAAVMLVLATGDYFGVWSPYCVLHTLPGFSWMRVACRFNIPACFALTMLAAAGAEGWWTWLLIPALADMWWLVWRIL